MLKFIASLFECLNHAAGNDGNETDLLQHPALARMNERELADLPLSPAPPRLAQCAA